MNSQLESSAFIVALVCYFIASVLYVIAGGQKKGPAAGRAAFYSMVLAFVLHSMTLVARTVGAGRPPFTNMYEFTSLFAWGMALAFLFVDRRYAVRNLGLFVTPLVFVLAAVSMLFPREIMPVLPALQSYWLHFHVITAVLAYGALGISFGAAVMYIIREKAELSGEKSPGIAQWLPGTKILDSFIYRTIAFAFPFLTLVIVTGAVWAEQAWGSYWRWDPKETWSLITWIIYACYLHARLVAGWKGRRSAWMAISGFMAVLFTYFGVNLILASIHSYV